ncbi:MAG: twin-arginine translocase TatA/TatE family subunit [Desulfomonile sp.]|nr:twin-arginine translocase TatA/TatE family subunit [Desulfomonile sp.]
MLPGPSELIVILLIVVIIFGAKRIPEIMGGLGKGIRSFKKAMDTDEPTSEPTTPAGNQTGQQKPQEPQKPASST